MIIKYHITFEIEEEPIDLLKTTDELIDALHDALPDEWFDNDGDWFVTAIHETEFS